VIVLDEDGRVLLFRGGDPTTASDDTWWLTPGGGVEGDETLVDAARRELREETGLDTASLHGPVHTRVALFEFEGVDYEQHETYFTTVVSAFEVNSDSWTDVERRSLLESRWWTLAELETTYDTVYPEGLAALVRSLSRGE
jgi:8-oxo-dGTP pyrophosphatase MutT (NUDIX family)